MSNYSHVNIDSFSKIEDGCQIGNNVNIGCFVEIKSGAEIGDNVTIGSHSIIYGGVSIGKDTELKSFVELRPNTVVGSDCYIDSRVSTSGSCVIGNGVTLRYGSIIARGCEIGDNSYLSPRVMTNNLDSGKIQIGGAKLGPNCFIGTNAVLHHGITLGNDVIIGAMSFVNKDCESNSTYIGVPSKKR
jgi:UDP-2-acetamido-3-amino-2,3-dideoxy-glucuronate N-acetyltransferase